MPKKEESLTIEQVKSHHAAGENAEARAGYLMLLEENPDDVEALHYYAILLAEEGDCETAIKLLQSAINLNPTDPALPLHLAHVYKASGEIEKAVEVLLLLAKDYPDFAATFNNLGAIYFAREDWPNAKSAYESAISLQPNYIDAYYNLALCFIQLGNIEQAQRTYLYILEMIPEHPGAKFQLGCLYMRQEKYLQALEYFSQIESEHRYHAETLMNMATCLLKMHHYAKAEAYYVKALKIFPSDTQILFNLGVLHAHRGKLESAKDFYLTALRYDENFFDAHNNLAVIYLTEKNIPQALMHFRAALKIQPNNVAIWHTILFLSGEENITVSPPEYIRSLFNSYANHYDAHVKSNLKYSLPEEFLAMLKSKLTQQYHILDLGCGTGLVGETFHTFAKHLVGVDLSAEMLRVALDKGIYDELVEADVLTFLQKQPENEFDIILAADLFEYIGDLSGAFRDVARVLKPGGYFMFNTEINDNVADFKLGTTGRFSHHRSYLDQLASKNHFEILSYRTVPIREQDGVPVYSHIYLLSRV